jgi:hypothetical protein
MLLLLLLLLLVMLVTLAAKTDADPMAMDSETLASSEGGTVVNIVLKSSNLVFDALEKHTGEYSVLLSTLQLLQQVFRRCFAREALEMASSNVQLAEKVTCGPTGRVWFAHGIDFVLEILNSCENWSFQELSMRWKVEQC